MHPVYKNPKKAFILLVEQKPLLKNDFSLYKVLLFS